MIKIMLVDDSPAMLRLIEGLIKTEVELDIEVLSFQDASLAKAQFLSISPDVVITDIDMPNVTGYDLIEYIKSVANTPILAMSGSSFENNSTDTILHCSELYGADHQILKSDLAENFSSLVMEIITAITVKS
ncbi:MAG: response regulator [Colwellia sp.]|uniref:response regulator n=1 Tax=Colwellia sp. TaxID=56799 RepID=UPI0025BDE3FA|nr:response regulator [Colwellia sp.]NQZ25492.1 response regulator [Colwellia sp.]